jgi:hypothetical protein
MNRGVGLGILVTLAFTMSIATTQVLAGAGSAPPQAPGGTPGPPNQGPTPTATWMPGEGYSPPPDAGQSGGPGNAQSSAQSGLHGKASIYRGTISALTASSLTLTLADASSISLVLTQETRIRIPGPRAQGDTLLVGMHVAAQAMDDSSGSQVVRSVIAIPGQPALAHRVGTVTAYIPGSSITIRAPDGSQYTFALMADTPILPADRAGALDVESHVTIIAPRDTSVLSWTAPGIVVHPPQS